MTALPLRDAPRSSGARLLASTWRQAGRSLVCPGAPRLDGRRVLVTGGSEGVGLGTCRGLLARGAEVVMASRSPAKGEAACAQLREGSGADARVAFEALDLSDLDRVRAFAAGLDGRFDAVVCNAGLWPRRHGLSPQGHELAFATNVLGHFLLLRWLAHDRLAEAARVVVVTGDIYVLAGDCMPDFSYRTPLGGMLAYCRSKLGNLWLAAELARRQPGLGVCAVHPGVVATSLGGRAGVLRRRFLLDADRGAQATLFAVSQPELPASGYLHNVLGAVRLPAGDPAADAAAAARAWQQWERLCEGWLPA